jgi:hypothetical protein
MFVVLLRITLNIREITKTSFVKIADSFLPITWALLCCCCCCSLITRFLFPGTSPLEPMVNPTTQASSFTFAEFLYLDFYIYYYCYYYYYYYYYFLSQVLFLSWYFSPWASGEPHHSGFKSQLVALSLWCVMFLVLQIIIIIIIIINIILILSAHRVSRLHGTSPDEPVVNPTTQASSLSL